MPAIEELLSKASESLNAARLLHGNGYHEFAASRSYYAMFYIAEALLESKGLSYSSHINTISAFGQHLAKPNLVPQEFHRFLIRAMEVRHLGDYETGGKVSEMESMEQIKRADKFLEFAKEFFKRQAPPGYPLA